MSTTNQPKTTRDVTSGRYRNVSKQEARAAARTKVTIDKRQNRTTPAWIEDLAADPKTA